MIELSFEDDFLRLERALIKLASDDVPKAAAIALTRVAASARTSLRAQLPEIFDRPVPFTVNAVRYEPAKPDALQSRVYLSEDAPKGISPRNYLKPEIDGGYRRDKRSERALKMAGMMAANQQWVPGKGASLDAYGNIAGPKMVQILSRLSAFGEQGYSANASAKTKAKFAKMKRAHAATGTDFFLAHGKSSGEPIAIYQIVGKGSVKPVLWFVNKKPSYKPRFNMNELVRKHASTRFPEEMIRALHAEIAKRK